MHRLEPSVKSFFPREYLFHVLLRPGTHVQISFIFIPYKNLFWSGNMELPEPASGIHNGSCHHWLEFPDVYSQSKQNHFLGSLLPCSQLSGLPITGSWFCPLKNKGLDIYYYLFLFLLPRWLLQWLTLRKQQQHLCLHLGERTALAMNSRHKSLTCSV